MILHVYPDRPCLFDSQTDYAFAARELIDAAEKTQGMKVIFDLTKRPVRITLAAFLLQIVWGWIPKKPFVVAL